DVLPDGSGAVLICSVGGSCGVRNAGVLPAFANPGPDDGEVPSARTRAGSRTLAGIGRQHICPHAGEIRTWVRSVPRALSRNARALSASSAEVPGGVPCVRADLMHWPRALAGSGLLSFGR